MGNQIATLTKEERKNEIRIWTMSDIHTDHQKNMEIMKDIATWKDRGYVGDYDVMIISGDVSSKIEIIKKTLSYVKESFNKIFFIIGNSELRLRRSEHFENSLEKIKALYKELDDLQINYEPEQIGNVVIAPIHSFYTPTFFPNNDGWKDLTYQHRWLDFRQIKFPKEMHLRQTPEKPSAYFDQLNHINQFTCTKPVDHLITFSHFLPRTDLLPFVALRMKPSLAYVVGNQNIDHHARQFAKHVDASSHIHLYGHSHINGDTLIDGVRYVQNAFAHPTEQQKSFLMRSVDKQPIPKVVLKIKK
mmetsp:Transcript_12035/g.17911  ORF Transcript_12035/g.17911 Transcript_12035/m.17911 type:complete len:303 (-) Transcript_12035:878-1786(-)